MISILPDQAEFSERTQKKAVKPVSPTVGVLEI